MGETITKNGQIIAVTIKKPDQAPVTITGKDVRDYLCPKASLPEIGLFLRTCQVEGLNPFAKEIYLIKYSLESPASIVISVDAFLKAAEVNDQFDGHEAGIILRDAAGKLEHREGCFLLDEEESQLVGGWAKVYRKDRKYPIYSAVNLKEYERFTFDKKTGERRPTVFWDEKKATMIRKVALGHAYKEAFPNRFSSISSTADWAEVPEGELPVAFTKNGKPDWSLFWAKQTERGVTDVKAHALLKVASIKADLVDKGKTLEEVHDMITKAMEEEQSWQALSGAETETGKEAAEEQLSETAKKANQIKKEDLPTLNALTKVCHDIWGLQPGDVWRELGYKGIGDVVESPWDCFLKIKAARA